MRIFVLLMIISLAACRPKPVVNEQAAHEAAPAKIPVVTRECYRYIKNKDTINMMLLTSGTNVTGQLHYKWFEKDQNHGTFEGRLHGDTLIARYTFNSEGRRSVREVAFLKKDAHLMEGFGPIEEKNGQVQFKDLRKLDFNGALVLDKVDCK